MYEHTHKYHLLILLPALTPYLLLPNVPPLLLCLFKEICILLARENASCFSEFVLLHLDNDKMSCPFSCNWIYGRICICVYGLHSLYSFVCWLVQANVAIGNGAGIPSYIPRSNIDGLCLIYLFFYYLGTFALISIVTTSVGVPQCIKVLFSLFPYDFLLFSWSWSLWIR